MSNSDSFIDEVTEEVRKDRFYGLLRRYGWIPVLLVLMIVGGTSWNEYRKAQNRAAAQALGDALIAALEQPIPADRSEALEQVAAETPGSAAIVKFLTAAAEVEVGADDAATEALAQVAQDGELPEIYRQIANFKRLLVAGDTLPATDRRLQFEALAQPGGPLRLLALEQLALIDISEGNRDAAVDRLQTLILDAEAGAELQQRASQLIVALGGTPEQAPDPLVPAGATTDG